MSVWLKSSVHEDDFFSVGSDITGTNRVIYIGVHPVAGSVAGVICEGVVEVIGGLMCPVPFVIKTGVDLDVGLVGACRCAATRCSAVGGNRITEGYHFLPLACVGSLGEGETHGEGDEAGSYPVFYIFHGLRDREQ